MRPLVVVAVVPRTCKRDRMRVNAAATFKTKYISTFFLAREGAQKSARNEPEVVIFMRAHEAAFLLIQLHSWLYMVASSGSALIVCILVCVCVSL